jgi:predicted nuclease of predicted toxin-antitoxin system
MKFLIDENVAGDVADVFVECGHAVKRVKHIAQLRGQADEVVFDFAIQDGSVLVSNDLDFVKVAQGSSKKPVGLLLLRFPHRVSLDYVRKEVHRLLRGLSENDFRNLMIFEPGGVRIHKW